MIRLLGRNTSGNVQKVIWALNEMDLPYEREDYGRQFENTGGEYLSLNPNGKVPTLIDGDVVIWESNSVLRYLARQADGNFYAATPADISLIERWMDWQLAVLDAPYLAIFREMRKTEAERSQQFSDNVEQLAQVLSILDQGLQGKDWVHEGGLSIADFCLGPCVHRCLNFEISLPDLGNLRAWHASALARPAFKNAIAV